MVVELGVPEEALDPTRVGLAGDQRTGAVTQRVEAQYAEPGRRGRALKRRRSAEPSSARPNREQKT